MKDNRRAEPVEILGVKVDCISKEDLLKQALDWVGQDRKVTISYVNAHCLNVAAKDEAYRKLLNQFDLIFSDGVGVVWAGRFLERRKLYKVTCRAWIEEFCGMCQEEGISLYLLGGKPGITREAQKRLQGRWPKLQILGAGDGYFHEKSEVEVLGEIEEKKPDVLLVGMGVPRQEKWMEINRQQIPAKVCWAVGAMFDYVAGAEAPVPGWMERLALEWVWRMVVDPRDKWKRYMIGIPLFMGRVLLQKLQ
jgi:N-acetylglucosaminyldiphosphoundecaprenol N-acetyl-beta-D-mannosaminyltransferase